MILKPTELGPTPEDSDLLARATEALRDTAADGPDSQWILRAQRIADDMMRETPEGRDRGWVVGRRLGMLKLSAASFVLGGLVVAAIVLLQRPGTVAFADVVSAMNAAHSYTAVLRVDDQKGGGGKGMQFKISGKGMNMRIEGDKELDVINQENGKTLLIFPSRHVTRFVRMPQLQLDLYGVIRNYHTGADKPMGEKMINGQKVQGFEVMQDDEDWILWVDPKTKLPVEVDRGPYTLTDLRYDVPLNDALFDTTMPPGYVDESQQADSWNQNKYGGRVTDEAGRPIAGVNVTVTDLNYASGGVRSFEVERGKTDANGKFLIDGTESMRGCGGVFDDDSIEIEFRHPDYVYGRLEDVHLLPPEQRLNFVVRMRTGRTIFGRVVDESGRGVAGALVETVFGKPSSSGLDNTDFQTDFRKAVLSDGKGNFELRGLVSVMCRLEAVGHGGAGSEILVGDAEFGTWAATTRPASVMVRPFVRPGMKMHELLRMKLVDVDAQMSPELAQVHPGGIMVIDPGTNVALLSLGKLEPGNVFWMVGQQRVSSFDEFARALATECEAKRKSGMTDFRVRVVFDHANVDGAWGMTDMMKLNAADLAEIEKATQTKNK
jgi:hypothetical protein